MAERARLVKLLGDLATILDQVSPERLEAVLPMVAPVDDVARGLRTLGVAVPKTDIVDDGLADTSVGARVFVRDGFQCMYCGFDGSSFRGWSFLHIDHFVPKSKGGTDDPCNLVTACCICNVMKRNYSYGRLEEARAALQGWWGEMRAIYESHRRAEAAPEFKEPTRTPSDST